MAIKALRGNQRLWDERQKMPDIDGSIGERIMNTDI